MKFRIEEKEAFEVFGLEKPAGISPSDFWTQAHRAGQYQKLFFDAGGSGNPDAESPGVGVVNGMGNYEVPGDYMIFAFGRKGCRTEGYRIVHVPKATWAVFQGRQAGHPAKYIGKLYAQGYKKWLPRSGYLRAPGPDMEIYSVAGNGKHYDEVWIPVTKA